MIIPLWVVPYGLLLAGGFYVGKSINVEALGWVLGIGLCIGWGWLRHRRREQQHYEQLVERQWLHGELSELNARREAGSQGVRVPWPARLKDEGR